MKIACYGFVDSTAGSVAGANFLILNELLRRGHDIDFFAKKDFVPPEEVLMDWDNFTYVGVDRPGFQTVERRVCSSFLPYPVKHLATTVSYQAHLRHIRQTLLERHAWAPYDIVLFLGTGAQFALPDDLPVVSWLQGPPQSEIESIIDNAEPIVDLCGPLTYAKLRLFYLWKNRRMHQEIQHSDTLICGSEWARQRLIDYGVAPSSAHALPYPFDLNLFSLDPNRDRPSSPTFVWLGRIVPRKRLDLLLDAFAMLAAERSDVHLRVVGHFDHFGGYRTLIDNFPYPNQISYTSNVPRRDVPDLLGSATALVQPSENENFGSSVAEALAVGTPVVLGPTNGTREYATSACFSFDEYTPESLYRALKACLHAQTSTPYDLAEAARKTAEDQFQVRDIVGRLETILELQSTPDTPPVNGHQLRRSASSEPAELLPPV